MKAPYLGLKRVEREATSSPSPFVSFVRLLMTQADNFIFVKNGVKKDRAREEVLK
jgi:hypothetical protein